LIVTGTEIHGNPAPLLKIQRDQIVGREVQGRATRFPVILGLPTFGHHCRNCFGFLTNV
jgi:hypothetical protein